MLIPKKPDRLESSRVLGVASRSADGTVSIRSASPGVLKAIDQRTEAPASPEPREDAGRKVIGADDRVRISPTRDFPFRAFGLLYSTYSEYGNYCSATLIGSRYLLTAAHCIFNQNNEWALQVDFYPGMDGGYQPYGGFAARTWYVPRGYTELPSGGYTWGHMEYDFGLVELYDDIATKLGHMGFGFNGNMPPFDNNIVGYPADKPQYTMWRASCPVVFPNDGSQVVAHHCDNFGGMSGGANYDYEQSSKSRVIYAVNIAEGPEGDPNNYSFRIDRTYYCWLLDLMQRSCN